jgi:cysteine synthase A
MKDRVAKAMVEAALRDGRLKPGSTVVEYTGGTTGVSLAYVCAALGLRSHFVSSDVFSEQNPRTIRGGELTLIPSDGRCSAHQCEQAGERAARNGECAALHRAMAVILVPRIAFPWVPFRWLCAIKPGD